MSAAVDASVDTATSAVTDGIRPLAGAGAIARSTGHVAWIDLRPVPSDDVAAIVQAAANHGIAAVVASDPAGLAAVPPTMLRVLMPAGSPPSDAVPSEASPGVDVIIVDNPVTPPETRADTGVHVDVVDAASLARACVAARSQAWTVMTFADPTKIPLEIVIAAAENAGGRTVTAATDLEDAEILLGVLEHGSDGVLLAPRSPDDVVALAELCRRRTGGLELCELTIESIEHVGMGDRACIDTCSLLHEDEGILLGSFSTAMLLSCSETHPLPYMPTRPFRVNAGALHTYVLGPDNRTSYLSELRAGHRVLAVRVDGSTREVVVGRIKLERRPLLSIVARTPGGAECNLIVQDDWHVRLLGPGGSVHNVTALEQGDVLMGHVPTEHRHVGLPISEFCVER